MEVEGGGFVGRRDRAAAFLHVLAERRGDEIADGGFRPHQDLHGRQAPEHRHLQQQLRRLPRRALRRRSGGVPVGEEVWQGLRAADLRSGVGHGVVAVERRGFLGQPIPPVSLDLTVTVALGTWHGSARIGSQPKKKKKIYIYIYIYIYRN